MPSPRFPIPQGTLDMLILQILSLGPAHGYAIAQRLEQISRAVVQVNQGSLYPALHRLEQKQWLKAEWKPSETGREAKFYSLTPCRTKAARRREGQLGAARGGGPIDLQRGEPDDEALAELVPPRTHWRSGLDRELRYHIDRRVGDLMRSGLPEWEAQTAGDAGARRPRAGAGGSARRLADPLAARLRVRPALLRPQSFLRSPLVHRHHRAVARARYWRNHRHLLAGRSGDPARASGPRTRAPGARRLEGRSGGQRVRQLESDVVPDLPRPSAAGSDSSKACSAARPRP